jgi:hypothetical protein
LVRTITDQVDYSDLLETFLHSITFKTLRDQIELGREKLFDLLPKIEEHKSIKRILAYEKAQAHFFLLFH